MTNTHALYDKTKNEPRSIMNIVIIIYLMVIIYYILHTLHHTSLYIHTRIDRHIDIFIFIDV